MKHPRGSLRSIAQMMLLKAADGDVVAAKEVCDRLDGKPKQVIAGDANDPIAVSISRGEDARAIIEAKLAEIGRRQVIIEGEAVEADDTKHEG